MTDPQSWLIVITIFTHVVHPYALFQFHAKQKLYKTTFTTGGTDGRLAEYIIDDSCIVNF